MPQYLFEHIDSGDVREVFFKMNDVKIYNGIDDKEPGKWKRVWTIPLAAISSIVNPYDPKSFTAATTNKKQTFGEMWQRSAEASAIRAEKEGRDPVKDKLYTDYKKATGLKHPAQSREDTAAKAKEVVKSLGLGT